MESPKSIVLLLFLVTPLVAAQSVDAPDAAKQDKKDASPVQEIKVKDPALFPGRQSKLQKPEVVRSSEELAKLLPDAKSRAKVAEKVDFDKQQLLIFMWRGSGGDKLTGKLNSDAAEKTIVFRLTAGRTRDLRPHVKLFAIPKDAKWKVTRKGGRRR